eukprot:CAMPEP_0119015602 /NCGR_PEP_ID=MMETSP1176-20130426/11280_1 /TAXON_ID=265551 /ORGANISM="Synedropsis recta cf, Strain CCMP1620" /LENGTH=750 /DNA_ID=CAMNT_0006968909 /DNA_START=57 /DNA_END=2309 /DNA_ORIENTATION=+
MGEHQEDGGFGMGGLQAMGIVSALKTGDVRVDMMIAMCIPFLLRYVFSFIENIDKHFQLEPWRAWWQTRHHKHQRFIVYKSTSNYWGGSTSVDSDTQNTVLIKAIQLYLHQKLKLDLTTANLDLTSFEDKNCDQGYDSYDDCADSDDEDGGGGRSSRKTLVGMLSRYKIVKKPPPNMWHKLGSFGGSNSVVELRISKVDQADEGKDGKASNKSHTTLTLHFVSLGPDSIDAFIDKAYGWYMSELRKLEDNSRYMYELQDTSSGGSSSDDGNSGTDIMYARYKLSDEKTFSSLFFQQKASLTKLVDHFQDKSGKYSISGYPHKLGLLLHGPPGTGKTSLIKALAQYTGRSIVNVSLSKISTNSELMSIFFDKRYQIRGESVPVKLGMKDVIFVMEDVDAASKLVKRRDGKTGADVVQQECVDLPIPKSMWRMMLESNDADCRTLVKNLMEKSERLKTEATKPEVLLGMSKRMMTLPGLGLVGSEGETLAKIGDEAINLANSLMDQYSTVDRFLGTHAQAINELVESGAEINDGFVDQLLGMAPMMGTFTPPPAGISRQVSYTKTKESDEAEVRVGAESMAFSYLLDSPSAYGGESKTGTAVAGPSFFKKKDQLNLSGLLNVLDGVVDTPGRIVIMTSNHPEQLDPALIRPGRIDKKLMLGYMGAPDVVCMLEHYFQVILTEAQKQRVVDAVQGNPKDGTSQLNLTPAQVEQFTAEHDEIEDMIAALEQKGRSNLSKMPIGTISNSTLKYGI